LKTLLPLILLVMVSACTSDEPSERIYRYPDGSSVATTYQPGMRYPAGGLVVDYRNHALEKPKEGQRWVLETGAFLLVQADGTIMSVVPARYVKHR